MYITRPFFFRVRPKNGTSARKTLGATDLKHGMHKLFDFGSDMGGISPGYTPSHWYVKQKNSKKGTSE